MPVWDETKERGSWHLQAGAGRRFDAPMSIHAHILGAREVNHFCYNTKAIFDIILRRYGFSRVKRKLGQLKGRDSSAAYRLAPVTPLKDDNAGCQANTRTSSSSRDSLSGFSAPAKMLADSNHRGRPSTAAKLLVARPLTRLGRRSSSRAHPSLSSPSSLSLSLSRVCRLLSSFLCAVFLILCCRGYVHITLLHLA